jgi:phenylpyruvate tautomerase PptA (4-oxalocrotonate tautomerase family)
MPYLHVYALPRSPEVKAKAMKRLTDVIVEECGTLTDQVHVIWHDVPADGIAKGGVTIAESKKAKG